MTSLGSSSSSSAPGSSEVGPRRTVGGRDRSSGDRRRGPARRVAGRLEPGPGGHARCRKDRRRPLGRPCPGLCPPCVPYPTAYPMIGTPRAQLKRWGRPSTRCRERWTPCLLLRKPAASTRRADRPRRGRPRRRGPGPPRRLGTTSSTDPFLAGPAPGPVAAPPGSMTAAARRWAATVRLSAGPPRLCSRADGPDRRRPSRRRRPRSERHRTGRRRRRRTRRRRRRGRSPGRSGWSAASARADLTCRGPGRVGGSRSTGRHGVPGAAAAGVGAWGAAGAECEAIMARETTARAVMSTT